MLQKTQLVIITTKAFHNRLCCFSSRRGFPQGQKFPIRGLKKKNQSFGLNLYPSSNQRKLPFGHNFKDSLSFTEAVLPIHPSLEQQTLVALEEPLHETLRIITGQADERRNLLGYSETRMGGKTTFLRSLQMMLQRHHCRVAILELKNFKPIKEESPTLTILRAIGESISNFNHDEREKSSEDQLALSRYSKSPFVLLVDDLHKLGALGRESMKSIEDLIGSKPNQFLVFTTSNPMLLSDKIYYIKAPVWKDQETEYSSHVSPLDKETCLSNPFLLSMFQHGKNVHQEVEDYISNQLPIYESGLKAFLKILINGEPENEANSILSEFGKSINGQLIFPILFISPMLSQMMGYIPGTPHSDQNCIVRMKKIEKLVAGDHVSKGDICEFMIQYILLMRHLDNKYNGTPHPFFKSSINHCNFHALQSKVETLDQSGKEIIDYMKDCKPQTVVLFTPTFRSFPLVDGFIVYKDKDHKVETLAIQVKAGSETFRGTAEDIPAWIEKIYFFRLGGAAQKRSSPKKAAKVVYLSTDDLTNFMGITIGSTLLKAEIISKRRESLRKKTKNI